MGTSLCVGADKDESPVSRKFDMNDSFTSGKANTNEPPMDRKTKEHNQLREEKTKKHDRDGAAIHTHLRAKVARKYEHLARAKKTARLGVRRISMNDSPLSKVDAEKRTNRLKKIVEKIRHYNGKNVNIPQHMYDAFVGRAVSILEALEDALDCLETADSDFIFPDTVASLVVSFLITDAFTFLVGSHVELEGGRTGVVRFLGPVHFRPGVIAGIELDDGYFGRGDGSVNGWRYFDTFQHKALFVTRSELLPYTYETRTQCSNKIIGKTIYAEYTNQNELQELSQNVYESFVARMVPVLEALEDTFALLQTADSGLLFPDTLAPLVISFLIADAFNIIIGSHVDLGDGRTGIVRFIGPVHFRPGVIAGIELDDPYLWTSDGSIGGWRYFDAPPNKAIFVKKSELYLCT